MHDECAWCEHLRRDHRDTELADCSECACSGFELEVEE